MTWWAWVLLGFVLLVLEVLTPGGFVAIFFGAAALVVGVLGGLGLALPTWLELLLFSVLSVVSLLVFRGPLLRRMSPEAGPGQAVDSLVGQVAICLDDIAPGAVGQVELRGTAWSARNDDTRALARGARAVVVRVDGLTLRIRAEAPGGGMA